MLNIWILNVGHGDSIILQYDGPDGRVFGLIDSNHTGNGTPRALHKLRELGAESLSFIALTHPHADHYSGLAEILREYSGAVNSFYSYPIGLDIQTRLKDLAKIYQSIHDSTDSPTVRRRAIEFVEILFLARDTIIDSWEELHGEYRYVIPQGFSGLDLYSLLPPSKVKGEYFQMIEKGDNSIAQERQNENALSLAFMIRYAGHEIILGGDGTRQNWINHKRQLAKKPGHSPQCNFAKLPHHGSKTDCSIPVIEYIFGDAEPRAAFISANGSTHPHPDTLENLHSKGIEPYCTNLAKQCGANIRELISLPEAAPVLRRLINSFGETDGKSQQPCQGDIQLTINRDGSTEINTQHDNFCPYRSDIADLFP